MMSPALLVMMAAIIVPLGTMIAMSLWSLSGYDLITTPTLGN